MTDEIKVYLTGADYQAAIRQARHTLGEARMHNLADYGGNIPGGDKRWRRYCGSMGEFAWLKLMHHKWVQPPGSPWVRGKADFILPDGRLLDVKCAGLDHAGVNLNSRNCLIHPPYRLQYDIIAQGVLAWPDRFTLRNHMAQEAMVVFFGWATQVDFDRHGVVLPPQQAGRDPVKRLTRDHLRSICLLPKGDP